MQNTQDVTATLSDDLKFLIACCQMEPSADDITFIYSYLNAEHFTTNVLIDLAHQHGVLPLVYKTLKSLFENTSPRSLSMSKCNPQILTELKVHYMHISQRNMLMSAELIRIMKLLEDNDIEALAFKGPTLSQLAYGDITFRQYSDLDILTQKKDIYKIYSLLKSYGYERLLTLTPVQEKIWIKNTHDMGFMHPTKHIHIEMHWSLLDEDYPMQVNLKDFWKELQEITISGHPLHTFSNENLLIYLCIHGSKHLWERIEWVKDIDLLIRNHKIDWEKIIENVKNSDFYVMFYLGLILSRQLFHTPLSHNIQDNIYLENELSKLSSHVFLTWTYPNLGNLTFWEKVKNINYKLLFFSTVQQKINFLYKTLFRPTYRDYNYIQLPSYLFWVYAFIRPLLLLKEYIYRK